MIVPLINWMIKQLFSQMFDALFLGQMFDEMILNKYLVVKMVSEREVKNWRIDQESGNKWMC